jgi:hypothetical protein
MKLELMGPGGIHGPVHQGPPNNSKRKHHQNLAHAKYKTAHDTRTVRMGCSPMVRRFVQWDATHQDSNPVLAPSPGFIPGFSGVMR